MEEQILKSLHYQENIDVKRRIEEKGCLTFHIIYLSSLISAELMVHLINGIQDYDKKNPFFSVVNLDESEDYGLLLQNIFEGNAVVFIYPLNQCYICDIKHYPSRGIAPPEVEKSVRGSKDSFSENLVDNIALIRRRIKSSNLHIENYIISSKSNMNVCLLYMDEVVDSFGLEEIKRRLDKLDLESLIMTDRALEESLFDQKKHFLPLIRYTERPDVASINLIRGKMILLVDTSSNALIAPICIFDLLKNVEEYKQNPIIGSFTKTLRLIGTLISIFLVPIFILLTIEEGFDNGIIKRYTIEGSTSPLLIQVMVISLLLEVIRIAVVHTPNALTSAISLLAAIVLGEVSLKIGLFSPEILLVCSLATICNFASPSYELSLANRIISLIYILFCCFWGESGFFIVSILLFLYMVNISILGLPYLYPIFPFQPTLFENLFLRTNKGKKK